MMFMSPDFIEQLIILWKSSVLLLDDFIDFCLANLDLFFSKYCFIF